MIKPKKWEETDDEVAALVSLALFNSASDDDGQSVLLVTILAAVPGGVDAFGGFGKGSGLMPAPAIWRGMLVAVMTVQTIRPSPTLPRAGRP